MPQRPLPHPQHSRQQQQQEHKQQQQNLADEGVENLQLHWELVHLQYLYAPDAEFNTTSHWGADCRCQIGAALEQVTQYQTFWWHISLGMC